MSDTRLVFDVIARAKGERELQKLGLEVALLERRLRKLDDTSTRTSKRTSGDFQRMAKQAQNAIPAFSGMATAAVALGPAIVPALAGATAATAGLGTAAVSAGAALGVFGVVAKGAFGRIKDAAEDHKKLAGAAGKAERQYTAMTKAWVKFQKAQDKTVMPLLARGFRMVSQVIPKLQPLFDAGAKAAGKMLAGLEKFATGGGLDKVVRFLAGQAGPALDHFGSIMGSLGKGFGSLVVAFAPLAQSMLGGLDKMAASFAKWAGGLSTSAGFGKFLDYIKTNGPVVLDTIRDLGQVVVNMLSGLAGPGANALAVVHGISEKLAGLSPGTLGKVAGAVTGVLLAFKGASLAVGALNLAMAATPVGATVAGLAAITAAIVVMWNTNSAFRNDFAVVMSDMGNSVVSFMPVVRGLVGFWLSSMGTMLHAATMAFGWIPGVGDRLKHIDAAFGSFKDGALSALDSVIAKTPQVRNAINTLPQKIKLEGDIRDLQSKVAIAKARLQDPNLTRTRKAAIKAEIADAMAKIAVAQSAINSLHGKTVSVGVHYFSTGSTANPSGRGRGAAGGGIPVHAAGGPIVGPGGPTDDQVPILASNGEYMIRAASVRKYGSGMLDAINTGRYAAGGLIRRFATGGKVSRHQAHLAHARHVNDQSAARRSHDANSLAALRTVSEWRAQLGGLLGSQDKIKRSSERLGILIQKGFKGSPQGSALAKYLAKETKALLAQAAARDKIATRFKAAYDRYKDLKKTADDYGRGVADNLRGSVTLTGLGSAEEVVARLQGQRRDLSAFQGNLSVLGKRGLNAGLLRTLAEGGLDGGAQTAASLAGASQSQIALINYLQGDISSRSSQIGTMSADQVYGGSLRHLQAEVNRLNRELGKAKQKMEITVHTGPLANPVEIGRQIRKYLDDYDRANKHRR